MLYTPIQVPYMLTGFQWVFDLSNFSFIKKFKILFRIICNLHFHIFIPYKMFAYKKFVPFEQTIIITFFSLNLMILNINNSASFIVWMSFNIFKMTSKFCIFMFQFNSFSNWDTGHLPDPFSNSTEWIHLDPEIPKQLSRQSYLSDPDSGGPFAKHQPHCNWYGPRSKRHLRLQWLVRCLQSVSKCHTLWTTDQWEAYNIDDQFHFRKISKWRTSQ